MASKESFQMVGNWSDQIDVGLGNAATSAMDIIGWDAKSTCMKALVYMAMTAKANTQKAPKKRTVRSAVVTGTLKRGSQMSFGQKYKFVNRPDWGPGKIAIDFQFWPKKPNAKYTWDDAKIIYNQGLAQRSWFWGFSGKGKNTQRAQKEIVKKTMPGVSTVSETIGKTACGYILANRLGYITKITPSNIEEIAAKAASNRIMAQAAKALERKFGVEVPRLAAQRAKRAKKTLPQVWLEGAE